MLVYGALAALLVALAMLVTGLVCWLATAVDARRRGWIAVLLCLLLPPYALVYLTLLSDSRLRWRLAGGLVLFPVLSLVFLVLFVLLMDAGNPVLETYPLAI